MYLGDASRRGRVHPGLRLSGTSPAMLFCRRPLKLVAVVPTVASTSLNEHEPRRDLAGMRPEKAPTGCANT